MMKNNEQAEQPGCLKSPPQRLRGEEILYFTRSAYNDIVVTGCGTTVTLRCPYHIRQSVMDKENPLSLCLEYARTMALSLAFTPEPCAILVVGLGGGTIPMVLSSVVPDAVIDVVEIDEEIGEVAKEYFGFTPTPRLRLFIGDGGGFIEKSGTLYDIIILDAYLGYKQTESLTTREFFENSLKKLTPQGVLAVNVMTGDPAHYLKITTLLENLSAHLWLLPGATTKNTIAFARHAPLTSFDLFLRAQMLQEKLAFDMDVEGLMERIFRPSFWHRFECHLKTIWCRLA